MTNTIKWQRLTDEAVIPKKAHPTDAGMDMHVIVKRDGEFTPKTNKSLAFGTEVNFDTVWDPDLGTSSDAVTVFPHQTVILHTGLKCAVPEGFYLEVNPRSSAGFKRDLMLANTTGVIDSHYRGELMVAIHNNGAVPRQICDGERLVQCMLKKVEDVENVEVDELDVTDRGEGGFGSTGTN